MPPVIDFHVHLPLYERQTPSLDALMEATFGSREQFLEFANTYQNPDRFVTMLREQGVDYAVILAEHTPLTTGMCTHEQVRDFCAGHASLIPFCTVNPWDDPHPPESLRRLCAEGFRGLKLYPTYNHFHVNDSRLYPLYAAAEDLGMPVLIHTGTSVFRNARLKYGNPIDVDDVAVDFPDLTLVLAHGGRGAWYDEAMAVTRLHRNVFIDVTGLPVRKLLQFFPDLERFAGKFLFGTDWPQITPAKSLQTFRSLGLDETALEAILGGNAARILGLDEAG